MSSDSFYPTVDLDFIKTHIRQSSKLLDGGILTLGSTTSFIEKGNKAVFKRTTSVRELSPNQICLEQATAVALKFSFLGHLIDWLEQNRDWKEGAYITTSKN